MSVSDLEWVTAALFSVPLLIYFFVEWPLALVWYFRYWQAFTSVTTIEKQINFLDGNWSPWLVKALLGIHTENTAEMIHEVATRWDPPMDKKKGINDIYDWLEQRAEFRGMSKAEMEDLLINDTGDARLVGLMLKS